MEALIEFAKIILPAGTVLYAMFVTIRMFLNKKHEKNSWALKVKNSETVLPIRLQAYERVCLFLERIAPKNLIVRLNAGEMTAHEFQQVLLHGIREEFGHNLSQQVYMSEESWNLVKNAVEEIVMLVNESAGGLPPEAKSIDLARKIFEKEIEKQGLGTDVALSFVKNEIQQLF